MMNDFTKEELNYMADGLTLIVHRCTVNPRELKDKLINLGEKLQGLIDNYCEHEYSESMVKINDKGT